MGAHAFAVEGPGPGPAMRRRLAGFVATLREAGFAIGQAEAQDAARLIASPLADRPEGLRAGMRALFASRRSDLARFDELFDAFWRARGVKSVVRIDAEALAARSPRRFQHGPGGERPPAGADPHRRRPRARGRRRGRRRAARRRVRARGDVEEGHRGLRGRAGARRGAEIAERLRARDARPAHAARARAPTRPAARPAGDDPAQRRPRRRADRPQVPPAQAQAAAARRAARRLRLDGALCRLLHPLPARGHPGVSRVRGLPLPHPARACFVGAERAQSGARARSACADGGGRRRRHQDRRVPDRLQPEARQARHPFAHLRHDPVGRLRHRPAGGFGLGDARTQAPLPAHRLAQSADRPPRLRAQRARHAGGASLS